LEGPDELTACVGEGSEALDRRVTADVEVGGADGVKTGFFEVELTQDRGGGNMYFEMGAFRPDVQDHWLLDAGTGGRYQKGDRAVVDKQGKLKVGDRVGVLVDLEEKEVQEGGSIQFFVNGSKFGSGFESGVTGPLVLGVDMFSRGQKVTLLPDGQRPAGF
jgi:hypothetical protein